MKNLYVALLLFSLCQKASAQPNTLSQKYHHQLQLIDSVRTYIQNTLHLNTGDDFYTKWSDKKDSMYYYVYVSNANRVESVPPNTLGFNAYTREESAIIAARDYDSVGYQTLIYKTVGTSDAEFTPKLLSYPDEAIAFIMVHESVHRHINSMHHEPRYPYIFEECLCDAMANKACIAMAKKLKMPGLKAAINQKQLFEKAFSFLTMKRKKLDGAAQAGQSEIFKESTERIKTLMANGNQFQKDRMIYSVNNAYFLRIESYATHYFEVKKMLYNGLTVTEVVNYIYQWKWPQ